MRYGGNQSDPSPRAYEDAAYEWDIRRVPEYLQLDQDRVKHPGRTSGIFVVHGIGTQGFTETAAQLRSGCEDALAAIDTWQRKQKTLLRRIACLLPVPFVLDGYWANYENLRETFPEDWETFNKRERRFFDNLWKYRTKSAIGTYFWILGQQLRLLHPKFLFADPLGWLLYLPLQFIAPLVLTFALLRHPIWLTGYLMDVRLYVAPQGNVERAIVQRIDRRVGQAFLSMIGLTWDFRPCVEGNRLTASGQPLQFSRIVWVAHSLGTVISFNVLSDLFARAEELTEKGDLEQKEGVNKFRDSLRRFVTLGSPLDKVAFLYRERLRPWPHVARSRLLTGGDVVRDDDEDEGMRDWWINFYHYLDPVSGALSNKLFEQPESPVNIHIRSGFIFGFAHLAYWTDTSTLRFILSRTYGRQYLPDRPIKPLPAGVLTAIGVVAYFIQVIMLYVLPWMIWKRAPEWMPIAKEMLRRWITH
jgi:hypothetical protein